MERTLSIQVLGAVGSGKTKLLALITTLLRKEGVLIVGSPSETVCAESVQVKFDAELQMIREAKTLTGYNEMRVTFGDGSELTIQIGNKTVEHDGAAYTVFRHDNGPCVTYEVGEGNVTAITVL